VPAAGDRAPDAHGLRRPGVGFPLRLFDVLRGTEHVLLAHLARTEPDQVITDLAMFARGLATRFGSRLRVVVVAAGAPPAEPFAVATYGDAEGALSAAYGAQAAVFLVRPDGYIGWRGRSWRDAGLLAHLGRVFQPARAEHDQTDGSCAR
jgi:hypothetical protein